MSKSEHHQPPELRVVDEDSSDEEVLRLDKEPGRPDKVVRLPPDSAPEEPAMLRPDEPGGTFRTHEPDLEELLAEAGEQAGPEEAWKKTGPKPVVPYGWFVLILLILGGSAFFAVRWSAERSPADQAVEAAIGRVEEDRKETLEAEKLVDSVEAAVRGYVNADSVEELLAFVRDRARVEPLIRDYYETRDLPEREYRRISMFQPLNLDGQPFFLIRFEVEGRERAESLILGEIGDGRFGVDWETDVKHQPMPWDDYVSERPGGTSMVFRVTAEPDYGGLFTHEFRNEALWRGFVLTAPDSEEFLIGYVRRDGDVARQMQQLLASNRWQPMALCLRLSLPEGTASPRGVLIEEVVSKRWLIQDSDA